MILTNQADNRRLEQSYRLIAWQIANSCAAILGPLLSYGVGHVSKTGNIHAYQAIFICMVRLSGCDSLDAADACGVALLVGGYRYRKCSVDCMAASQSSRNRQIFASRE